MEIPISIIFNWEKGQLKEKADNGQVIKSTPLKNVNYKGGILDYTVDIVDAGVICLFKLSISANEIKGVIDFSKTDEPRKGSIRIARKGNSGQ